MGDNLDPLEGRTCDRSTCGQEYRFSRETLSIFKPNIPLLNSKCPYCSKSSVLDKDRSIALIDQFFPEEYAEYKETGTWPGYVTKEKPADKRPETAQVQSKGEASESGGDDGADGTMGWVQPPPVQSPSAALADRVEKTLLLLGYKGKAWQEKLRAVKELVSTTLTYQNPQGLVALLGSMGIDAVHAQIVLQRVFKGVEGVQEQKMQQIFAGLGGDYTLPGNSPASIPIVIGGEGIGKPTVHQTPQGSVIIMPAVDTRAKEPESRTVPGRVEVIEELDDKGRVKARRYIGGVPDSMQPAGDPEEKFLEKMLKMRDLFGPKEQSAAPQQRDDALMSVMQSIADTVQLLGRRIDQSDQRSTAIGEESQALLELREQLHRTEEKLDEERQRAAENRVKVLEEEVRNLRTGRGANVSDHQAELGFRKDSLETVVGAVESLGTRVVEPLVEMNKVQVKLQALLMAREMARQDGANPADYIKAMSPAPEPTSQEVQATVDKWKQRADSARATQEDKP